MADTSDFRVMTSGAFTAAHLELLPQLERLTQKKVVTVTTSVGTGDTSIPNRLKRGEIADIVIVSDGLQRELLEQGFVLKAGHTPLARSTIGVAVRAGAPKPDLTSTEGLKRAFLSAKTIAYSASVSGQYLTTELYQRLGIAEECLPKSKFVGGGERTGAVVARGEADIAFQQMSELLPVPGIAHITPLPPELQKVTLFSAAVGANSPQPDLARTVIAFLASAEAAPAIAKTGLEPLC
ncbi:MAG TPA: substrate-binding domain-containing protein [Burkholderiales bacterium]|nr:substrate-binding domain-containing protein [Burkholderiales bacterium]